MRPRRRSPRRRRPPDDLPLIVLFTDFGPHDLYVAQVKAVLARLAPRAPVLDATHSAPDFGIAPAAHLLAALAPYYPRTSVFLAVVDPGVGGGRDAIVVEADGRKFVGPDNGLLSILWQRARGRKCWRISWRPRHLSDSFHGRDLFAPVAGRIAAKDLPRGWLAPEAAPDVLLEDCDLPRVIYIDHFGNCITGIRAQKLPRSMTLRIGRRVLRRARTFEEAGGRPFWYRNSIGLAEIALPQASAARTLRLRVGQQIRTGLAGREARQPRRATRRAW